jgi:hypothetical protein
MTSLEEKGEVFVPNNKVTKEVVYACTVRSFIICVFVWRCASGEDCRKIKWTG